MKFPFTEKNQNQADWTKEEADKEMKHAQEEFDDTVGTCVVFLNQNGMNIDVIRQILHHSVDGIINDYMEKREKIKFD